MKLFGLLLLVGVAFGRSIDTMGDTRGSTDFTFEFFRQAQMANSNQNSVMSPISIRAALAMLYNVASLEAASEMQQTLRLSANPKRASQNLRDQIRNSNNEALKITTKVFHSEEEINPNLLHLLKSNYEADTESVNFGEPEKVAESANRWINKSTNGLIQQVLNAADLDPLANLLLLNAVALNASWNFKFNSEVTEKQVFHFLNGDHDVDMMYQDDDFRYGNINGVHVVELSYEPQTDLSMWILMPEKDSLDSVIQKLNTNVYHAIDEALEEVKVILQMPKFSISQKTPAKTILETMGLKTPFNEGAFNIASGKESKLAEVQQRARIDVTEDGVSAAAVTELQFVLLSGPPKVVPLTVNRPFVYLIRKNSSKDIFFIGSYSHHQ